MAERKGPAAERKGLAAEGKGLAARRRDRGSGTVLMLAVTAVAGFLTMVTLMLAAAVLARHRAGAIADLSALAAANAGKLTGCRILDDGSVLVSVELAVGGRLGPARGLARAGNAGKG